MVFVFGLLHELIIAQQLVYYVNGVREDSIIHQSGNSPYRESLILHKIVDCRVQNGVKYRSGVGPVRTGKLLDPTSTL